MVEADKCINCGKIPHIIQIDDFYYVQCGCGKWSPYRFMGIKINNAIDSWNYDNRPIERWKYVRGVK